MEKPKIRYAISQINNWKDIKINNHPVKMPEMCGFGFISVFNTREEARKFLKPGEYVIEYEIV